MWTTTELEKDRNKKKGPSVWRFGRQMKLRKSGRKATAFDAFDLTEAGGPISKAKKRLIFLATWKMLDEAEREFAASLFVQVRILLLLLLLTTNATNNNTTNNNNAKTTNNTTTNATNRRVARFAQVWWRRWLYRDRPDEMAKCVGWSASRSRIRGI